MKGKMLDLGQFSAIDWDDEADDEGNLAHCLRHGVDERTVDDVLSQDPVQIDIPLQTAEIVICGPARSGMMWTLLFAVSYKRQDWLRPVTGWEAKPPEIRLWKIARGRA
jgi:hypothetical protein